MSTICKMILGVDGGGTKTVACLAQVDPDGNQKILGRGRSGSSNLKAVGTEMALENLLLAIRQAWSESQQPSEPAAFAVMGLSGAGRPEAQALLQKWNQENQVAQQLSLVHDALPVLVAGTSLGCGVALIAGTGSVAFASDAKSNTAVVGGWGYWFGDEGSAFWLGQAALRSVAQAADGRTSPTLLTQAILDRLAITEPREMLTALALGGDVRSAIAGLADLVSDLAEQQDSCAQGIVSKAAEYLSDIVLSAAKQVDLGKTFPLALAGGVLCGSRIIRDALLEKIAAKNVQLDSVELVNEPVLGCLMLAQRELTSSI